VAQQQSDEWFTKNEIARRVFGTTPQNFDKTYRPAAPVDAVRKEGREVLFHCRRLLDGLLEQAKRQRPQGGEGDPLLADGDSPNLERYRGAKADLAEMQRDRERKQIVRVEEIEPALMQLAGVMRSASENLARQYGNEAAGIVNEAVDEWADGVAKLLAGGADPDGVEGSEAADDAAVRRRGVDPADRPARGASVQD
jgi:phage terminase Nu1 subunit (DNA packaging protein)